jgi:SNF2 family DNA or RNA helicase
MTHRVSKDDPQVAAMFPDIPETPTIIDWNPKHRGIYDKLTGKAKDMVKELEDSNILSLIQIMQMVCDAPSMVLKSAENRYAFMDYMESDEGAQFTKGPHGSDVAVTLLSHMGTGAFTDAGHTKLEAWRDIILDKHPNDKIVTHSTWAEYIFPVWEYWLQKWGVTYVIYHGTGKQKQAALDAFRDDPSIQCFLSGDAGSDSIDIAEAAVGVNYNIPWKWTTLKQREGRRDRVTSGFDTIYTYTLTMPDSVDERKAEVCERKYEYHATLFDGKARDETISANMTRSDLLYMLFG